MRGRSKHSLTDAKVIEQILVVTRQCVMRRAYINQEADYMVAFLDSNYITHAPRSKVKDVNPDYDFDIGRVGYF